MTENIIFEGIATAIFDKCVSPVVNGIKKAAISGWEKFTIDFDFAFSKYLENSIDKYGKIKTILYRTEPKPLYDFFECPNLEFDRYKTICGDSIDNLLNLSHFIIINGTGGIGKSTFLKHLFLDETANKTWIPIFIELKDLNTIEGDYDILDFFFQKLFDLGCSFSKECLHHALQAGCFVFLLDGLDEILSSKKGSFFRKFDSFCDSYSKNFFIMTSRPYSDFVEFQRFSVLSICALEKYQALSLIGKLDYDPEIKSRFLTALDEKLYISHRSFASNPLLLTIMFLTFEDYANIPKKLHLFYSNAFDTLYSRHDATKAGYCREMKSALTSDLFKRIFSIFCFRTHCKGVLEFTPDELHEYLNVAGKNVKNFNADDYLSDLLNAICVLCKDGLNYRFTHRSFQEYFAAVFLKDLSDEQMRSAGKHLLKTSIFEQESNVLTMLHDMAEARFEQNILLPFIQQFEKGFSGNDKYDFYFNMIGSCLTCRYDEHNQNKTFVGLEHLYPTSGFMYLFIKAELYDRSQNSFDQADYTFLQYLYAKRDYGDNFVSINALSLKNDPYLYTLFKETWLGNRIHTMSKLRETLEQKYQDETFDLTALLID